MYKRLGISIALIFTIGMGAIVSIPANGIADAASPVLKKGDQKDYVWGLQNRLQQLGLYKDSVDGNFGSSTRQAVKQFQKQNGLTADGHVGEQTWKTLRNQTYTSEEIQLLAQLVYSEAKGESLKGQVGVAAVALNRIDSGKFPNSVNDVIYQHHAFTAVQQGTFYDAPNKKAYQAVYMATAGWDPSNGSLYYFNPDTATSSWIWTRPQTVQIGNHIFAK